MKPEGYVIMQYTAKEKRPIKAYLRWANRIPETYNEFVLQKKNKTQQVETDKNCIGLLKHYYSLAPMSMEVNKPIFLLKPRDGAIGAHVRAVKISYNEFYSITQKIISICNIKKTVLT